jgi:glycosyltransferase involved in cell wall biosynthesis
MRILQITSNDAKMGGGIAVTRLHEALLKQGHTSCILSFSDMAVGNGVKRIERSLWWRGLDGIARRMSEILALPNLFKPSIPLVWRAIDEFQPDVIHLHWTYSHGLPLSMLPALTRRYPLVWTFHDMYAFTGGCTNSLNCERWQTGCGDCPQLHGASITSMLPLRRDSTAQLWRAKCWLYRHSRFTVVGPSQWVTELAKQSPLLVGQPICRVPNSLDTDFWKPLDRISCKQALDIVADQKVLLFVGKPHQIFFYPGRSSVLLQILVELREMLPQSGTPVTLLLVGAGGQLYAVEGYEVVAVGAVTSSAMMRVCYNAADLLIDPTQFDNFPGVIQEAMACGTPVVASNVGGVPDMIHHRGTGYLARADAPQEFARGIYELFSNYDLWSGISQHARRVAVEEFQDDAVSQQMTGVYANEIARRSVIQSISHRARQTD